MRKGYHRAERNLTLGNARARANSNTRISCRYSAVIICVTSTKKNQFTYQTFPHERTPVFPQPKFNQCLLLYVLYYEELFAGTKMNSEIISHFFGGISGMIHLLHHSHIELNENHNISARHCGHLK